MSPKKIARAIPNFDDVITKNSENGDVIAKNSENGDVMTKNSENDDVIARKWSFLVLRRRRRRKNFQADS